MPKRELPLLITLPSRDSPTPESEDSLPDKKNHIKRDPDAEAAAKKANQEAKTAIKARDKISREENLELNKKRILEEYSELTEEQVNNAMAMTAKMARTTVHCGNLHDRTKPAEKKRLLHDIFDDFGKILEIRVGTGGSSKGQAWVCFDSQAAAEYSAEACNEFVFDINHPNGMNTTLSNTTTDAYAKTVLSEEDFQLYVKQRRMDKTLLEEKTEAANKLKRPADGPAGPGQLKKKGTGLKSTAAGTSIPEQYLPPNKILFVQNVPPQYDFDTLSEYFAPFEAFKELRKVPGPRGWAFVEYENLDGAMAAKQKMHNAIIPGCPDDKPLSVTYQRTVA